MPLVSYFRSVFVKHRSCSCIRNLEKPQRISNSPLKAEFWNNYKDGKHSIKIEQMTFDQNF